MSRAVPLALSLLLAARASPAGEPSPPPPPASAQAETSPAATSPVATETRTYFGTVITRDQFAPLTGDQRWRLYWRQTYASPSAYFRTFGTATVNQFRDEPDDWDQDVGGFMLRSADAFGRQAVARSIEAIGAAAFQHDVRFLRCTCKGFFPRAGHAIAMQFATVDHKGRYAPAVARFAGALGAGVAGDLWMPEGHRSVQLAVKDTAVQFALGSVINLAREFAPLKKKKKGEKARKPSTAAAEPR